MAAPAPARQLQTWLQSCCSADRGQASIRATALTALALRRFIHKLVLRAPPRAALHRCSSLELYALCTCREGEREKDEGYDGGM